MKILFTLLFCLMSLTISAQQVSTLTSITPKFGDGMIVSPKGEVLVSGGWNKDNILRITKDGKVSNFDTGLPGPVGMGYDSKGNLYVSNYTGNSISKITPDGTVTEFASGLDGPAGLIVNEKDEIFVTMYGANFSGVGSAILKFDLDGNYEKYVTGSGLKDAIGIVSDEKGNLFVTNYKAGNVFKIGKNKNVTKIATIKGAFINQICLLEGYLYIPSPNLRKIYRVNTSDGNVVHFAGTGNNAIVDKELMKAQFNFPNSCAVNTKDKILYILDGKLGIIRMIELHK